MSSVLNKCSQENGIITCTGVGEVVVKINSDDENNEFALLLHTTSKIKLQMGHRLKMKNEIEAFRRKKECYNHGIRKNFLTMTSKYHT